MLVVRSEIIDHVIGSHDCTPRSYLYVTYLDLGVEGCLTEKYEKYEDMPNPKSLTSLSDEGHCYGAYYRRPPEKPANSDRRDAAMRPPPE